MKINKIDNMIINPYPGKFIAFEGLDGSGKSTQAKLLWNRLNALGRKTILTREPYKNMSLKADSRLDRVERQTLFIKDSLEHLVGFIIPKLENGVNMISDRYRDTGFAYWLGEGGSLKEALDLHKKILGFNFILPNITFFIDTPVDVAMKRLKSSRKRLGYFEREEKMEKNRIGYVDLYSSKIFNEIGGRKVEFIKDDGHRPIEDIAEEISLKTTPIFDDI